MNKITITKKKCKREICKKSHQVQKAYGIATGDFWVDIQALLRCSLVARKQDRHRSLCFLTLSFCLPSYFNSSFLSFCPPFPTLSLSPSCVHVCVDTKDPLYCLGDGPTQLVFLYYISTFQETIFVRCGLGLKHISLVSRASQCATLRF